MKLSLLTASRSLILATVAALGQAAAALPPWVDLSGDTSRQVVIARGDAQTYQGHPTTVLLPDGKTMFAVWSYDHGGVCGPMKRSDDGGLTWSPLLDVPENWSTVKNCPTIYRLVDPQGVARLFVFAGQGPDGNMHQAYSEDGGKTWSPMKSNGLLCVMPFCTIVPIDGGKRLLGLTNIRRPGETVEVRSNVVAQSISEDGGFTWTPWRIVLDLPGLKPCEPFVVRSPSGKQLLCLIRENTRKVGSLFMTSDDEGRTWSETRTTPAGLFGDRHMARYAEDGRLVVCFRDVGPQSPTRDHFVAWVGRYEDIVAGRLGQYRLKLLHSFKGRDCGYPGLELLPDGTFVATTYIKYREGPEKNSVVSARFRLSETDRLVQAEPSRRVSYRQVGQRELHLEVFNPSAHQAGDQRPCLVLFHGGGWGAGAPRMMHRLAAWAAALDWVGISVEYRLYRPGTDVSVFTCVEDARSAIRSIRAQAVELGIDPAKVVVGGASAGGHLAVATALFDGVEAAPAESAESCRPDALVLFSPVIDTSADGYGQAKIGARWRELSPLHQVRAGMPPTILFHGSADTVTPFTGAVAFHEAARQAGNRCDLVVAREAQHTYMFKDARLYAETLDRLESFFLSLGLLAAASPAS